MSARQQFISDAEVEAALDYLRDSSADMGRLTEQAIYAERFAKHVIALEMKKHDGSAAAQEREARASEAYMIAISNEAKAAGALAGAKALREAAAAKIEAWRTSCSNFRSMKI